MSRDDELIARLLRIDTSDPEAAHATADDLLRDWLPEDVRRAYDTVANRCRWWAFS